MNEIEFKNLFDKYYLKKLKEEKRRIFLKYLLLTIFIGIIIPVALWTTSISKPHNFTSGQPIASSQVNANFDALYTKVNELDSKLFNNFFTVKSSTAITTAATTITDLADMTLTVTTDGSPIKIDFAMTYFSVTAYSPVNFYLYRDSTLLTQYIVHALGATSSYNDFKLIWVDQPTAGTYTYKIAWMVSSGYTVQRDANCKSILVAEIMKR